MEETATKTTEAPLKPASDKRKVSTDRPLAAQTEYLLTEMAQRLNPDWRRRVVTLYTGGVCVRTGLSLPIGTRLTSGYAGESGPMIGATDKAAIIEAEGGIRIIGWDMAMPEAIGGNVGETADTTHPRFEELEGLAEAFHASAYSFSDDPEADAAGVEYRSRLTAHIRRLCTALWPQSREVKPAAEWPAVLIKPGATVIVRDRRDHTDPTAIVVEHDADGLLVEIEEPGLKKHRDQIRVKWEDVLSVTLGERPAMIGTTA